MDPKEIRYDSFGWILVVLYMAQRLNAYKYGNEFQNFKLFENFFRPGGRPLDF